MNRKAYKITYLFLVYALCSCTANSDIPDIRRHLQSEQAKIYGVDKIWWQLYQNKDLNRIIDAALQNNTDYLKAALSAEKALYNLRLTASDLFPTLTGSSSLSSNKNTKNGDSTNSLGGSLSLNYELDLYGKIYDAYSAKDLEYNATLEDEEAAKLSLINNVIDAYFQLVYLHNAVELSENNTKSYNEMRQITATQYKLGKTDNLEMAQADQSLLTEKNNLLELQTQFRQTEQTLRNILNLAPNEKLEITYNNLLKQKNAGVDLNVPFAVLANRPDIKASQFRLEKSFYDLRSEQKNWYPTISLQGSLSSSSSRASTAFNVPYIFGSVTVDLPFLDWNRVKNNVKISETEYKTALLDFKDTVNQALNETAYYYFAYQNACKIFENTQMNYRNAVKITEYYRIRYKNGKAEFKDLLEAINTENSTRKNLVAQKYQILQYESAVYEAMGGRYGK